MRVYHLDPAVQHIDELVHRLAHPRHDVAIGIMAFLRNGADLLHMHIRQRHTPHFFEIAADSFHRRRLPRRCGFA